MPSAPILEPPPAASLAAPRASTRASMLAIALTVVTGTAADLCVKLGATETAGRSLFLPWLGIVGLESKWVWFGIVFTVLSFLFWVRALRTIPLGIAFCFSNVIHIAVPLTCWLVLGEAIGLRRWLGIGLVVCGLLVIARPYARLDQRLDEAL
jgi:undecaprenyl phosphate-alpha-L-ara4N flippase subunit ArnF